jgi:hypothetical protein
MRAIFHFVTHRWRAVALVTVGALAGGTVWAVAAVPGTGGTVTVCYETTSTGAPVETTPNLTLIDPSAGQSCSHIVSGGANSVPLSAAELTLNQTGPAGPAGAPGAAGVAGATGATGATGPAASVTPTAIGTITFKPAHRGSVGTGTAPIVATVVSLTVGTKVSHGTLTVVLKDNGPALLKATVAACSPPTRSRTRRWPTSRSQAPAASQPRPTRSGMRASRVSFEPLTRRHRGTTHKALRL